MGEGLGKAGSAFVRAAVDPKAGEAVASQQERDFKASLYEGCAAQVARVDPKAGAPSSEAVGEADGPEAGDPFEAPIWPAGDSRNKGSALGGVLARHPALREWLCEVVAQVAREDQEKGAKVVGMLAEAFETPAPAPATSAWGGECPPGHVFDPDSFSYVPGVPLARYEALAVRVAALEQMFPSRTLAEVLKDARERAARMKAPFQQAGGDGGQSGA